ncbi:coiled-coil domain-containing protein 103 [Aplysia californica]|uniref:Coiled-coil domain-containing protein 103 n=1 Tax=Aplysia californica TaxID=6500 RepID=A0ABM0K0I3_APLCA|nr:coiled-coil domain-containing protein 103 [Aplysia californica]
MASTKVSHDDDNLDFNKIEAEVQKAVDNDAKYWRENDAKIRAVEQRVGTYDEFREIVLAAHLQPLEKEDKISSMGTFTQVWNQAAEKKTISTEERKEEEGNFRTEGTFNVPKSGQEFVQRWKRLGKSAADQRKFLFTIGATKISELFKTEISGGLLGEFLECFQVFANDEVVSVIEMLEAFMKSQRFSLSLAFLSRKEKAACAALLETLKAHATVTSSPDLTERVAGIEKNFCGEK